MHIEPEYEQITSPTNLAEMMDLYAYMFRDGKLILSRRLGACAIDKVLELLCDEKAKCLVDVNVLMTICNCVLNGGRRGRLKCTSLNYGEVEWLFCMKDYGSNDALAFNNLRSAEYSADLNGHSVNIRNGTGIITIEIYDVTNGDIDTAKLQVKNSTQFFVDTTVSAILQYIVGVLNMYKSVDTNYRLSSLCTNVTTCWYNLATMGWLSIKCPNEENNLSKLVIIKVADTSPMEQGDAH